MPNAYHEIAFTPAVKALQEAEGSRKLYEKYEASPKRMKTQLTPPELTYIAARDSFYMSSVGETGWPYMQHRGGPAGFIKPLNAQEFGWAEYVGNRQYISTGNIAQNDRVALFFIDYASKTRLKLFGHARVIAKDDPLMVQLGAGADDRQVERGMVVRVASYEWNCPKYITERYTRDEIQHAMTQMGARIAELEALLAAKDS
ncbi:pyridoxamine 5'-phosphate oxidase family protein [uncultured Litoreibacter sp.]|uniref:pyridoxamine 5'-phosphate oxidase family protein n=1 Tax=uncultured Litoreibacter sp. TaxID=1392394 RepID=UPI00262B18DD|nr:pyridoxamine 5'-phosphate oxidase family protein [uncultured Litoreibacter sp.]